MAGAHLSRRSIREGGTSNSESFRERALNADKENGTAPISKQSSRELRKAIHLQISQIGADWFMHPESAKMDLVICGSIIPIHGRRER